jgi:hypothetical protein
MRSSTAILAGLGLGIALTLNALAQDNKGAGKGQASPQTIRGVVSAVTAESELVIDYRTKQAVMAGAAYATIVGSPVTESKSADSGQRDNVYVAWFSPRTKFYKVSDSSKPDQKTPASLDDLQVGDRVEVQFVLRDATDASTGSNQTEQMRRKHGRDRIYVGDAMALTILPPKSNGKSPAGS